MGNQQGFYQWIGLTAVMGAIFLGGQFIEYQELQHLGITLQTEDFSIETTLFEESIHIEEEGDVVIVEFENEDMLTSLGLDNEDLYFIPEEGEPYSLMTKFEGGTAELSEEEFGHLSTVFANNVADATSGFGMRFYAPTAFHGLHVLGGVIWALVVLLKGRRGQYKTNAIGIEIFGLYWHFVDVVWILLFTLIYLI